MNSIKSVKVAGYIAICFITLTSFYFDPVHGSVLRDESAGVTTSAPEVDAINDEIVETTVVYRSKREAVTEPESATLLDDNDATTVSYRVKREAVTDTTQSDDVVETTVSSRVRRNADTTESTQADDIEYTTSAFRTKREAVTEVVTQADDIDEQTTPVSRSKREAVTEVTQSDNIDETTVYSRAKRDAVTDTTLFDDNVDATTVSGRFRRETVTELVDVTQSDDNEETTVSSRVRREAITDSSTLSNDLRLIEETTAYSLRVKREAPEIATETITGNEIAYDATEKPTDLLESQDADEDDGFRYPTTPFPFPSEVNSTEPEDINEEPSATRQFSQNVVKGNLSCSCGFPNKKIVGGSPISISDLPWTVALVRKRNDSSRPSGPYCGGTLVSNRYVVTASHCVDGFEAEKIQVWLNEEDFRVEDENLSNTIRVDVEEIIMHEMYDSRKINNDIALLKLAEPVDIENGVVTPACIPADNTNTFDNEEGIVAGWGATEQGGKVSSKLQHVSVPIISNKKCNWRTLYLGRITENQLCAGDVSSGGKDSCQGDSGGPLIVRNSESQAILVGVVSYGFGCAKPYAPGVYTRVSQYPKWIVDNSQDGLYCSNNIN